MLSKVHTGHLGVNKTIERAKENLFWPGMVKQITDYVLKCTTCLKHRMSNANEPMISHPFPERPFQKIGTDIFTHDGTNYLITIDYYSRFFEIDKLPDTRAETVIRKLSTHMSRYGIVDTCMSDNGPQFSSSKFAEFAHTWGFEHITSSPYHSRSNGMAEKGVSIAKRILTKAKETAQDPYIFLLEYRNTPLDSGYSPTQLLMGRRTKSVVPIAQARLKPQTVKPSDLKQKMDKLKSKQKQYFDKNTKQLQPLEIDDSIRMQTGKIWTPGRVISKHSKRSYNIQTHNGAIYRRNRQHLIKTREPVADFQPNILANPQEPILLITTPAATSNTLSHPSEIRNSGNVNNGQYFTRSGRLVKPSTRYQSDQFVTA